MGVSKKNKKCPSSSASNANVKFEHLSQIDDRLSLLLDDCENGLEIRSLSSNTFDELWTIINKVLPTIIQNSDTLIECLHLLNRAVVNHPRGVVSSKSFQQILQLIHEVENNDKDVRDCIIKLDDSWLSLKDEMLPEIPSLIRFSLLHTANSCLAEKPLASDLKRLGSFRKYLNQEVLANCSFAFKPFFKQLIQHQVVILNSNVEKLLSQIMSLSLMYLKDAHFTISGDTLAKCRAKMAEAYGRLYIQSWHQIDDSDGKTMIEEFFRDILDKFMNQPRTGLDLSPYANNLLRIIDTWHVEARKANNLEFASFVSEAYRPILWKHLESEFNYIRVNAAELMFKAFPLYSCYQESSIELFNQQVTFMESLLKDDCHFVRVIAIKETCNALTYYWTHFTPQQVQTLLTIMCKENACDVSSASVRRTVYLGLQCLLKNPSSSDYLMEILQMFKNGIHDANRLVRIAVIQLLIAIRNVNKPECDFRKMANYQTLLSRLAIEGVDVGKWLVELMLPVFYTPDSASSDWMKRFVRLITHSPRSYRNFFMFSRKALPMADAVTIMCEIIDRLGGYVKGKLREEDSTGGSDENREEYMIEENGRAIKRRKNQRPKAKKNRISGDVPKEQQQSALDDPMTVVGLLDIISILWVVHDKSLNLPQNKAVRDRLFGLCITYGPSLITYYKNAKLFLSVITLYGNIPMQLLTANSITLPGFCMKQLKSLGPEQLKNGEQEVSSILMALMKWGRSREILEQVQLWLEAAFGGDKNNDDTYNEGNKSRRRVKINETIQPNSIVAVYILDCLIKTNALKQRLLTKNYEQLLDLWKYMGKIKDLIVKRLFRRKPFDEDLLSDEFLKDCFRRYVKLIPLLNDQILNNEEDENKDDGEEVSSSPVSDDNKFSAIKEIEQLICWSEVYFPPLLLEDSCIDSVLICTFCNDLLRVCDNMFTINMCSSELYKLIGEFTIKLLTTGYSLFFVHQTSRLAVALNFWGKVHYFEEDKNSIWTIAVPSLITHMLNAMVAKPYSIETLDHFKQDFQQVKTHISKIFSTLEDNFKMNYQKNSTVVMETFKSIKLICQKILHSLRMILGREVPRSDFSVPEYTNLNQLHPLAQCILAPVYSKSFFGLLFLITIKEHPSGSVKNILIDIIILNMFAKLANPKYETTVKGVSAEVFKRLNDLKTRRESAGEKKSLSQSLVKLTSADLNEVCDDTETVTATCSGRTVFKSLENHLSGDVEVTKTNTGPISLQAQLDSTITDTNNKINGIPEAELIDDFILCGLDLLTKIERYSKKAPTPEGKDNSVASTSS